MLVNPRQKNLFGATEIESCTMFVSMSNVPFFFKNILKGKDQGKITLIEYIVMHFRERLQ